MKILCFGEILLRLSPPDGLRLVQTNSFDANYGGSEANVAISLAQLGISAGFATRLPNHELGRAALGVLSRYGVDIRPAVWGGERLGLYFLEAGAGRRGSKVLYDRNGSGMTELCPGMIPWREVLEGRDWLHWSGITCALSKSAADATLEALVIASEMGLRISCDLNYRAQLWQYAAPDSIMPTLTSYVDLMLGDASAFELYYGIRAENQEALLQRVMERFPRLSLIAMTARQGYSASHNAYQGFLYDGHKIYSSPSYELPDMLDRIGGGDAFMAGLLYGIGNGAGAQETVDFAAAAAALKHYVRGDFNLSTEQEIRSLMGGNSGGRVQR